MKKCYYDMYIFLYSSILLTEHRSRSCWGAGGDQRLSQLSIGTKGSLLCVEVV